MSRRFAPILLIQGATRAEGRTITITGATLTDNGGGDVDLAISGGGGGGLWTSSGYTGTADRIAGFTGAGAAGLVTLTSPLSLSGGALSIDLSAYLTVATAAATYQPLDAGLTSLLGQDGAAGLLYTTGAATWARASLGDLAVSGASWQVTQARGLLESGGTTLAMATVADGELLWRVGTTVDGLAVSETPAASTVPKAQADGTLNANWFPSGVKAIELFSRFSTVIPSTGTALTNDGAGTLTTGGIYAVNVGAADFPCIQLGDSSSATSRFYVTAAWRTEAGTTYIDGMFQLGSDISTGNQWYFIGLTSQVTLASDDPAGHRVMVKRVPGGTEWYLTVKDGTTESQITTGVAFTASWFYRIRLVITSADVLCYIGLGATAQDAVDSFDAASSVGRNVNMPTASQDLILITSLFRSSANTARHIKVNSMWTKTVPAWAA